MCEVNGKMYLAGLVSWGIGCATEGKYALISYALRFWYFRGVKILFTPYNSILNFRCSWWLYPSSSLPTMDCR